MIVGSVFSGMAGFELGLGLPVAWQIESDPQALRVLGHHYPNTERTHDVREASNLRSVDLICGGFPCQDLSVAGSRAGLAGARSGLWFEFIRIVGETKPEWVLIENVPGLLSSRKGRDFAVVFRGLAQLGYGVAWRVLDSQHFGVPQRRRRVFIVGHLGTGRAAEILFESACLCGNPAPGREAGEEVAGTLGGGAQKRGWCNDLDTSGAFIAYGGNNTSGPIGVATACNAHGGSGRSDFESETFVCAPLTGKPWADNEAQESKLVALRKRPGVRRLTPTECLRLQGFPDDWLDLDPPLSDSAKYRMIGNAVTVNVIRWIGKRLPRQLS